MKRFIVVGPSAAAVRAQAQVQRDAEQRRLTESFGAIGLAWPRIREKPRKGCWGRQRHWSCLGVVWGLSGAVWELVWGLSGACLELVLGLSGELLGSPRGLCTGPSLNRVLCTGPPFGRFPKEINKGRLGDFRPPPTGPQAPRPPDPQTPT